MVEMGVLKAQAMLKIRPFRKGFDEEVYVSIYNAAFGDYDDIRSMTLEEMEKLEKSPSFSSEGMFIAEWNGETAGMVSAHIDKFREEKKGFVQNLGVLPKFRRRGIAAKLFETALESLKKRGMEVAETWAQTDRQGCIHLFEKFGFKQARITSIMIRKLDSIPGKNRKDRQLTIRDMQMREEKEIELLNKLDNESFREHFNFRPVKIEETKYVLFGMPWFTVQKWFFAVLNDQPVGYCGVAIDEGLNKEKNLKWGLIADIGVLKPYRRIGIGTLLMLHMMQELKDLGMKDAFLYVDYMNPTGAMKLYEKLGFKTLRKSIIYQLPIT
jgi:mycothiol synthase